MLDQARPDTIQRYGMKNVQELMKKGTSFPNALVGHMAAETVVSHNVITSGQFPKHMGWSNEVHRDVDGVLGTPGRLLRDLEHDVHAVQGADRARRLQEASRLPRRPLRRELEVRLDRPEAHGGLPGRPHEPRAATVRHRPRGHHPADPRQLGVDVRRWRSGWRAPEDANPPAPAYFNLAATCNRWWTWQGRPRTGRARSCPARIYPLEGDRFVPGRDPAHLGGDVWSADAAISVIQNDPAWRGMLVSLGGIDKMGHMWGPEDEETGPPGSDQEMRHMPFVAKTADAQVGKIIHALKRRGLLDETLVVITADHAAQTGREFHGRFDTFPPGVADINLCDPATGSRPQPCARIATGTSAVTPTRCTSIRARR